MSIDRNAIAQLILTALAQGNSSNISTACPCGKTSIGSPPKKHGELAHVCTHHLAQGELILHWIEASYDPWATSLAGGNIRSAGAIAGWATRASKATPQGRDLIVAMLAEALSKAGAPTPDVNTPTQQAVEMKAVPRRTTAKPNLDLDQRLSLLDDLLSQLR